MYATLLSLILSSPASARALAPEARTDHIRAETVEELLFPDGGFEAELVSERSEDTQAELDGYARAASLVIQGEVLTSHEELVDGVRLEVLTVLVNSCLRGPRVPGDVIEVRAPLMGAMSGEVGQSFRAVRGYELLMFVGEAGYLVTDDALYVMEGGFGFRALRPDVLMRPRIDHDWVQRIDPTADYSVVAMGQVESTLERVPMGGRKDRRRAGRGR